MRKGLIEMFDSFGYVSLQSLEFSKNGVQKGFDGKRGVNLFLYTSDDF